MDDNDDLNSNKEQSQFNNEITTTKQNFGEIKLDNFEDSLSISDIAQDRPQIAVKEGKNLITEDFSEDLNNINEDEFSQRKMSDCSIQSDEFKNEEININTNTNNNKNIKNKRSVEDISKKYTRKITKEELDNIPLPLFSCIYCSNMMIAFKHLSQEIVTNKYLFQTSIYDIKDINKLIIYQPLIDKDKKNEKLLNIIIKSTEYVYYNYTSENIKNFFCSKNYIDICNNESFNNKKYFTQKIEESIVKKKKDFYFKGIKNIPKNSLNNKGLFNSTNSMINNYNALSGFVENIQMNNNPINYNFNINKNYNSNNSNISINFNSISLNNNEIGNCLYKDNNNNNLLVSIVEHIENNNEGQNELDDKEEFIDLLELDEEKKISKDNIIWDNNYYDIWNPVISDVESNNSNNDIISDNNHIICENYCKSENNNNYNLDNNTFINKKRRYMKNITRKKKINNFRTDNIDEGKKNYKLKVNLLKSKTSNNSFNYNLNQKLGCSQVKSFGSTNSSTMINLDNDYKIKNSNNFSNVNNISNNSQILIHVNTIHENENFSKITNNTSIVMNNKDIPSKSQNFFHGIKNNQDKIYHNFFNENNSCTFHPNTSQSNRKTKSFNTNKNFFNTNFFSFKICNNYDISNMINTNKYNKNKGKEKKIKERNKTKLFEVKKTKNKNTFNASKTVFHVNSSISKPNSDYKNKTQNSLNHIYNGNKVISSQILFKQNCFKNKRKTPIKFNISNNSIKQDKIKNKTINNQRKYNLFQLPKNKKDKDKDKDKLSLEKIRQKIADLNKYINNNRNNYHTNLNSKTKTSLVNNSLQVTSINNNKNVFGGKHKLCLSNSFLSRAKPKVSEKNSRKKFLIFKK